jgi:hypothetical protein
MNFIRRIGRNEMYIKYVHQLVNVSVPMLYAIRIPMSFRCNCRRRTTLRRL